MLRVVEIDGRVEDHSRVGRATFINVQPGPISSSLVKTIAKHRHQVISGPGSRRIRKLFFFGKASSLNPWD